MEHNLEIITTPQAITIEADDLPQIGLIANQVAASHAQERYQKKITQETARRQKADLAVFCRYLADAQAFRTADGLIGDLSHWKGISHGLVEVFVVWQEQQGYAIGSINVRLATVKAYCKLARKVGVLTQEELGAILSVTGYSHKEGRNLDEKRPGNTRVGHKKAEPTLLNAGHAALLKRPSETAQGRRDALIMCLLLDHGLRCGEVAELTREGLDVSKETLLFYRKKVDLTQIHRLTSDTLIALMAYLPDIGESAYLFPGYNNKHLGTRAINARVQELGKKIGIESLSPHDCRHYWATIAMRNKTDVKSLQTAGGWKSPAMPLRYAQAAEIANEGVKLS